MKMNMSVEIRRKRWEGKNETTDRHQSPAVLRKLHFFKVFHILRATLGAIKLGSRWQPRVLWGCLVCVINF